MAEKDLISKKIEDYNEVFADIYNTLLFQEPVLSPEHLKSGSTESVYQTEKRGLNSQSRDILKTYHGKANQVICSLGIENQASIDKTMPIRSMGYDSGSYRQQLNAGEGMFTPVITIVLNMTDKRWCVAKSLHELLHMDGKLAEYVQDYRIHVFDIAFLEDETIDAFTSDFREIARFFKKRRLGEDPLTSDTELEHPREIMEFISVFTQDRRYMKSVPYLEKLQSEGGGAAMCKVVDALIEEGMEKGMERGMERGIEKGMEQGILSSVLNLMDTMKLTVDQAMDALKIPSEKKPDYIAQIQKR